VRLLLDGLSVVLVEPDKFVGPQDCAGIRFIADSRDHAASERLDNLEDPYRLFRCTRS